MACATKRLNRMTGVYNLSLIYSERSVTLRLLSGSAETLTVTFI